MADTIRFFPSRTFPQESVMPHASTALLDRAQTVAPFTQEFNALIAELFPNDTRLLASLKDHRDTVCLLETSLLSLHLKTCNPDAIIQAFNPKVDSIPPDLLGSAYAIKAGRTLLLRCKQVEREMPIC